MPSSGQPQHQQEVPQDDLKEEKEEQDAAKPTIEAVDPDSARAVPKKRSPGTKECAPCQGWAFYNLLGPRIISNHKEPLAGP